MTAAELAAAPHYVYRLRDAEGSLLYVGCAVDPAKRLREHQSDQPWSDLIASQDVEGPYRRLEALRRETSAIRCEHPRFNVRHNPKPERWAGPSDEVFLYVQKYIRLSGRELLKAFWRGEIPLEPTDADIWLYLRTLDTRYHGSPCYRSCHCGNYWSDVMYLAEDHRRAEEQRFLREQEAEHHAA
jgi:predicted GIY-YIG superfamily endonuclease